jgi:hypothetical protein
MTLTAGHHEQLPCRCYTPVAPRQQPTRPGRLSDAVTRPARQDQPIAVVATPKTATCKLASLPRLLTRVESGQRR